jgi:YHS domain-containing protein
MNNKKWKVTARLLLGSMALFLSVKGYTQSDKRLQSYNTEKGLAIEGYDPVAYFVSNKAVKYSSKYGVSQQGITYYFYSQANKEAFLRNPEGYKPQYGGWCAYALGDSGEKVSIDPETFKI